MITLEREGYGSSFNELSYCDDIIIKMAKNEYGKKKIEYEKRFFEFINASSIVFPIPISYVPLNNGYSMKYYKGSIPLYQKLQSEQPKLPYFLNRIYTSLEILHASEKVNKDVAFVRRDLIYEMIDKIKERNSEIRDILEPYKHIQSVNGLRIESYETLFAFFEENIDVYLEGIQCISYCPIHGDCQFNNILVLENDEILFIDPRGYFGKSELYGLKEYDYAKVYFALTGYDRFDACKVDSLNIEGSNITLPEIAFDLSVLYSKSFTAILATSIWLGNPHSFKDKPLKAVYSYFYGLYLASLVYKHVKSLIK